MTKAEFEEYLRKLHDVEMEVREIAHGEYAHTASAFANFERRAKELGISREKVLWIFASKHLDGILAKIKNPSMYQRDTIQGRILDARLYLALLGGMFEESERRTS